MPRTIAVECPGCPPMRALTTDALGLIKVVEVRGKVGTPQVVETWGPPDASRSVLVASLADREIEPLLAVARKNGLVEFLSPLSGDSLSAIKVKDLLSSSQTTEDDLVVGLHLLGTRTVSSPKSSIFLMCTEKGKACLRSISMHDTSSDSNHTDSSGTWDVCGAGNIICSSVDGSEVHALFGGKGVELNVWHLDQCSKIWTAKHPPSNSLGIFSPTWFTAATFLNKEDHRKIAAGTNFHQVRLYDISAQRRPVMSFNFRESPIKVVSGDQDGYTLFAGTGSGDLASFDMRTGKLLGCFIGKCSGSIRSIARHPELPIIASCGLDSYLRVWDTKTRQLLSAVFLKQHLTTVSIDSHLHGEEMTSVSSDQPSYMQVIDRSEVEDDEDLLFAERSERSRGKKRRLLKLKKNRRDVQDDDQLSEEEELINFDSEDVSKLSASKHGKATRRKDKIIKLKQKKSNTAGDIASESEDDDDDLTAHERQTVRRRKGAKWKAQAAKE